jgi:hypothetical protein
MKILIGALGATKYKDAFYELPKPVHTKYFIYGIAYNEKPDRIIVLTTEEAYENNWESLKSEICSNGDLSAPEPLRIPIGATQQEAWEIFTQIAHEIPQGSDLIVDITTSLRSIPILLLSAVRYLQHARNVSIRTIYYGAFEAQKNGTVPVYSMDSFISLLDWASAIDAFKRTGNAVLLAERLEQHQSDLAIPNLQALVRALAKLSRSLDLTLSQTIVVSAHQLVTVLSSTTPSVSDLSTHPLTQPILNLLNSVLQEFEPFAVERPQADVRKFLKATFKLIEWYSDRERYANALQLAREWCVTWCMFRDKKPNADLWQYKKRDVIAKSLKSDPDVGSFWENMRKVRNLISHTESQETDFDIDDPAQLDTTINDIRRVVQEVLKLRSKVEAL